MDHNFPINFCWGLTAHPDHQDRNIPAGWHEKTKTKKKPPKHSEKKPFETPTAPQQNSSTLFSKEIIL